VTAPEPGGPISRSGRAPVLNEVKLDALIAGDGDFLDALIDEILFTVGAQIERIEHAMAQGRPTELRLAGEALRMAGETVGAPRFTEAARAIIELGKNGVLGGALDALTRLREEFERMTLALREYAERHAA
jgi:hypothetical protein